MDIPVQPTADTQGGHVGRRRKHTDLPNCLWSYLFTCSFSAFSMNWYGVVFFVLWQNFFTASSTRTLHAGLVNRANLPNCPTCPTCPALPPTCPIYPTQPPTQWHGIPNPPTAHGMTSIIHQHRSFQHFSLHYFGTVSAMHLCGASQQCGRYFVYNNTMIVLYGMGVGIARVCVGLCLLSINETITEQRRSKK